MNRRNFLKGLLSTGAVAALAPLAPVVELPVAEATFLSLEEAMQICLKNFRNLIVANLTDRNPYFAFLASEPHIMSDEEMKGILNYEPPKDLMLIRPITHRFDKNLQRYVDIVNDEI